MKMRYLINTFVTFVLIGMFALHPLSAAPLLDHILENFPPEERKAFSREKPLVRVSLISCPEYDFYVSQPHARRFLNIDLHGNHLREKKEEKKAYSVFFEINNRVQWTLNIQEQAVVRFLNDVWQDVMPEKEFVRFSDLVIVSSKVSIPEGLKTSDFSDDWISENRSFLTFVDYGLTFKRTETQTSFSPLVRMMLPVLPGQGCPDLACLTRLFISSLLLNPSSPNAFLDFEEPFQRKEDGSVSYVSQSLLHDFLNESYDYRAVAVPPDVRERFHALSPERVVLSLFTNPWVLREGSFRFSTLLNLEKRIRFFQEILKQNSVLTLEDFFGKALPEVAKIYHETSAQSAEYRKSKLQNLHVEQEEVGSYEKAFDVYQRLLQKMLDYSNVANVEEVIGIFNAHCLDFVEKFDLKSMREAPKKASPEEHLSKEVFPLIYGLLSHPKSHLDSFLWAFYLGFDANYKPNDAHSLLENMARRNEKGLLALVLKEGVNPSDYLGALERAILEQQRHSFIELIQGSSGEVHLRNPEQALYWFRGLDSSHDDALKTSFQKLMRMDSNFAWRLGFEEVFPAYCPIPGAYAPGEIAPNAKTRLEHRYHLSPSVTRPDRFLMGKVRTTLAKKIDFNRLFGFLEESQKQKLHDDSKEFLENRPLIKRINRSQMAEKEFQAALLSEAKFIYEGIQSLEEFYKLDMMARYLIEIRFLAESLSNLHLNHRENKNRVISAAQSYFAQTKITNFPQACFFLGETERLYYKGLNFGERRLSPLVSAFIPSSVFIESDSQALWTFKTSQGRVFVQKCPSFPEHDVIAQIVMGELFKRPLLSEILFIEGQWFFVNFSLGHEEEGSLEADSTNLDPRTCSEQFLESLLLAPQNQTLKDLHFSLDHQGRLRLQSMGYRENLFQIHPERIKSFLFTHPRVGNQVLDSSLYEIFRRLDPLELLTRSLQTSAKIHREALGDPNAQFPLSFEEIAAFYTRLYLLKRVITQAYDPLTLTHEMVLQRIFSCKMGGAEQRDGQEEKLVARTALASLDVLHNFGNIWSHAQDKGNFFGDYVGLRALEITPENKKRSVPYVMRLLKSAVIPPVHFDSLEIGDLSEEDFTSEKVFNLVAMRALNVQGESLLGNLFFSCLRSSHLYFLNISGTGVAGRITGHFPNLETCYMEGIEVTELNLKAPSLKFLSLKGCTNLQRIYLEAFLLEVLDLTGVPLDDASWNKISTDLLHLKYANLKDTHVSLPFLRSSHPLLKKGEMEEVEALKKRLITHESDPESDLPKMMFDTRRVRGAQDLGGLTGTFVAKVAMGPAVDLVNIGKFVYFSLKRWSINDASPLTSPLQRGGLGAVPFGSLTVAGGITSPLATFCLANPWTASFPVAMWSVRAARDIHKDINHEKEMARALLGRMLANYIKFHKLTHFSLEGLKIGCVGLAHFILEKGLDGLTELNLTDTYLKDDAAELLVRYLKSLPEQKRLSFSLKMGGRMRISPWFLSELAGLAKVTTALSLDAPLEEAPALEQDAPLSASGHIPEDRKEDRIVGLYIAARGLKGIQLAKLLEFFQVRARERGISNFFDCFACIGAENSAIPSLLNLRVPKKGSFWGGRTLTPAENRAFFETGFQSLYNEPNLNLRNPYEPQYDLGKVGSVLGKHFQDQKLGNAHAPIVVKIGSLERDILWTSQQNGEIGLDGIVSAASISPWPYFNPICLNREESSIFLHETTGPRSPGFLYDELRRLNPRVNPNDIHVLFIEIGEDPLDLRACHLLGSIQRPNTQRFPKYGKNLFHLQCDASLKEGTLFLDQDLKRKPLDNALSDVLDWLNHIQHAKKS